MRRYGWLVVALLLLASWAWQQRAHAPAVVLPVPPTSMPDSPVPARQSLPPAAAAPSVADGAGGWPAFLPAEAVDTLQRIARRDRFPHRQDGATFQNREHRLPPGPRGYYREYTVETPGSRDRGARRLITGGDPPVEYFYSDDHYRSFRRFTSGGRQ